MPDDFSDDQDASDARREVIVQIGNLTNGMMGGLFDQERPSGRVLGLSRPHSTAIWRMRVVSAIVGIGLVVLTIVSPLILALTVGPALGVTIALGAATVAAWVVFVSSYLAERRDITRRRARDEK